VRNGDILTFSYGYWQYNFKELKLVITDMDNNELQTETFEMIYGDNFINFTIEVGEFTGDAKLTVYRVFENGKEEQWEEPYKLNVVAADKE
jgi:hypothetical protein